MTVNDINQKEFTVVKRGGYDQEEVQRFMTQMVEQLQTAEAEKTSLIKKLEVLAHKIEEYKKDEQSIQAAVLGAQKLAQATISDAQQEAEKFLNDVRQKTEAMLKKATNESEKMMSESKEMSQQLMTQAKQESEKAIIEAQIAVEKIQKENRYAIEKEQANLFHMQKEVSLFKKSLLDLYRAHIDLIQKLPEEKDLETTDPQEIRHMQNDLYMKQVAENKSPAASSAPSETPTTAAAEQEKEASAANEVPSESSPAPATSSPESGTEDNAPNRFMELQFGKNVKR